MQTMQTVRTVMAILSATFVRMIPAVTDAALASSKDSVRDGEPEKAEDPFTFIYNSPQVPQQP